MEWSNIHTSSRRTRSRTQQRKQPPQGHRGTVVQTEHTVIVRELSGGASQLLCQDCHCLDPSLSLRRLTCVPSFLKHRSKTVFLKLSLWGMRSLHAISVFIATAADQQREKQLTTRRHHTREGKCHRTVTRWHWVGQQRWGSEQPLFSAAGRRNAQKQHTL